MSSTGSHIQSPKNQDNVNNSRLEHNSTPENWYDIVMSDEEEIQNNDSSHPLLPTVDTTTPQSPVKTLEREIKVSPSVCDNNHDTKIHSIWDTVPTNCCEATTDCLKTIALQKVLGSDSYEKLARKPSCRQLSIDELIALIDRQEKCKRKSPKSSKGLHNISTKLHNDAEKTTATKQPAFTPCDKGKAASSSSRTYAQSPVTETRKKSPVLVCSTLKAKCSANDLLGLHTRRYSKRHLERSFEAENDSGVDVTPSLGSKLNVPDSQCARLNATLPESYRAPNHMQNCSQLLDLSTVNSKHKSPITYDTHVDHKLINHPSVKHPHGKMRIISTQLSSS